MFLQNKRFSLLLPFFLFLFQTGLIHAKSGPFDGSTMFLSYDIVFHNETPNPQASLRVEYSGKGGFIQNPTQVYFDDTLVHKNDVAEIPYADEGSLVCNIQVQQEKSPSADYIGWGVKYSIFDDSYPGAICELWFSEKILGHKMTGGSWDFNGGICFIEFNEEGTRADVTIKSGYRPGHSGYNPDN